MLITEGSGSAERNSLFHLINHQPDIDKNYLYARDQTSKLTNKLESTGSRHFYNFKSFY